MNTAYSRDKLYGRPVGPCCAGWSASTADLRDQHLLLLFLVTWALRTRRPIPPSDPAEMTEDELMDFWADPALFPDASAAGPHPAHATRTTRNGEARA